MRTATWRIKQHVGEGHSYFWAGAYDSNGNLIVYISAGSEVKQKDAPDWTPRRYKNVAAAQRRIDEVGPIYY